MKTLPNRFLPAALVAAFLLSSHAVKALGIPSSSGNKVNRSSTDGIELSGITWAGGNTFYAVNDSNATNRLYKLSISLNSSGAITSCSIVSSITLASSSDLEGCAYDPASGTVWVSMEGTNSSIREYDPETGAWLRTAPLPTIFKNNMRDNFKLEALTISGDGLTMWTANEEALTCDGDISAKPRATGGTTVRLQKFTRTSVRDNWTATAQYAYKTYGLNYAYGYNGKQRSGVSGLCALPNGQLLVLEREFSGTDDSSSLSSIFTGLSSHFTMAVVLADYSSASDVSTLSSLDGATYTPVYKTNLTGDIDTEFANYEGFCLGPRNSDGSTSLLFISDGGGNSMVEKTVMSKKLTDINVRTLSFAGAADSEPVGGPYRYVSGSTVAASLSGAGNPYEANTVAHAAWNAPANNTSGNGSTASFTVTADDTFSWSWSTNTALPLVATDSFERHAVNTEADAMEGWSGEGFVSATSYSPAVPAGYPLQLESHSKVLVVDGDVERDYSAAAGTGTMLDTMVRVTREIAENPVTDVDNCQVALYFDANGRPTLQHASAADGTTLLRTTLSEHAFANDDWVRTSLIFATNTAGAAWCQVRLNGEPCVTAAGIRSPSSPVSPGSWHRALGGGTTAGRISSVALQGSGAVDDVALYGAAATPAALEFDTSAGTSTNGVPYAWLSDHGLPWNTALDLDGDGFDSASEWTAGTDPLDALSFPRHQLLFFIQ